MSQHLIAHHTIDDDLSDLLNTASPDVTEMSTPDTTPGLALPSARAADILVASQPPIAPEPASLAAPPQPASDSPGLTLVSTFGGTTGQSATTTQPGTTLSATSTAAITDDPSGGSLSVRQSITAGWTGPLAISTTWTDGWAVSTFPTAPAASGQPDVQLGAEQGLAALSFTFTLASAGSVELNWGAITGGANPFGLLDIAARIDNGAWITSPSHLTAAISPTGSAFAALAAGTHSITLQETPSVTGFLGTQSGTVSQTLGISVSPISPISPEASGADLLAAQSITTITRIGSLGGQYLTGQDAGQQLFTGTRSGFAGDCFTNLLSNDLLQITDLGFTDLGLSVTNLGNTTLVTLSNTANGDPNASPTSFSLVGSFSPSSFHLASDGGTGILLSHS